MVSNGRIDKQEILNQLNARAYVDSELSGQGVKWNHDGTQAMCLCPNGHDTAPSLSITLKPGAGLVYKCFGCGNKGSLFSLHAWIHRLNAKKDFPKILQDIANKYGIVSGNCTPAKPVEEKQVKGEPIAIVEKYHQNLLGNPAIYENLGFNKDTVKRHKLGFNNGKIVFPMDLRNGLWNCKHHKGVQQGQAQLYPDIPDSQLIYLFEGEPDCLLARQDGLPAITGTGGASTFKPGWSEALRGKNIVICYDYDKAGDEGVEHVAKMLLPHAKSVERIEWSNSGLVYHDMVNQSKDLKDYRDYRLKLGKTVQDFLALPRIPVVWTGGQQPVTTLDLSSCLWSSEHILNMDVTVSWVVDKMIPSNALVMVSGAGGTGKSILMMLLATAIAQGLPFMGLSARKTQPIIIDYENGIAIVHDRIRDYNIKHVMYWHRESPIPLPRLDDPSWELFKQLPPGSVLIFDTLKAAQDLDENSSQEMGLIMGKLRELTSLFTVIFLHHTPKGNSRGFRGSGALSDQADIHLSFDRVDRATKQIINDDTPSNLFVLETFKTRYAPFKIYLERTSNGGYVSAESPKDVKCREIQAILDNLPEALTQTQLLDHLDKTLELKRKKALSLLEHGEGTFWTVKEQRTGRSTIKKYHSLSHANRDSEWIVNQKTLPNGASMADVHNPLTKGTVKDTGKLDTQDGGVTTTPLGGGTLLSPTEDSRSPFSYIHRGDRGTVNANPATSATVHCPSGGKNLNVGGTVKNPDDVLEFMEVIK